MNIPHPAIPANPSLWALHKIHDQATRWLDHCEEQETYYEIEAFIYQLEIKINEFSQLNEFLTRCYSHEQQ